MGDLRFAWAVLSTFIRKTHTVFVSHKTSISSTARRASLVAISLLFLAETALPVGWMVIIPRAEAASLTKAKPLADQKLPGSLPATNLGLALSPTSPLAANTTSLSADSANTDLAAKAPKLTKTEEDVSKRTETSETFKNPDGSATLKQYFSPKYFHPDNNPKRRCRRSTSAWSKTKTPPTIPIRTTCSPRPSVMSNPGSRPPAPTNLRPTPGRPDLRRAVTMSAWSGLNKQTAIRLTRLVFRRLMPPRSHQP